MDKGGPVEAAAAGTRDVAATVGFRVLVAVCVFFCGRKKHTHLFMEADFKKITLRKRGGL